ncbi:B3/4 domain protein [Acidianus hospitalis W1]|uniref:B3/4 domain protein n=1 Tax=Acidianus hospitalis (strain W1) TaxID=933801 RepID=F4B9Q9_ACIHW|nr:phenylalanine--tRNA ligase beta subunit-related protein [Acidianus hospitalis]AEE93975.1 B3/4 domain protein [Acidianus hospitalis W1]
MNIVVSEDCKNLGIFIAHTEVLGVNNSKGKLEEEMRKVEEMYSQEDPEKLKINPIVRAYRDFYWKIGIDPTKVRPAGEALRRRINRSGKLPRINDIVDAGNIASSSTLVPIGIYDISKIIGEPSIILSKGGEEFYAIGKDKPEILQKGIPIMVDKEKVMHIYPHRDSKITSVTDITRDILIVGAGVPGVPQELVGNAVNIVVELVLKYLGGKQTHQVVFS